MKNYILALILAITSVGVLASGGGGKVSNPWQLLEEDECAAWSINTEKTCTLDPTDQSGSIYICETLVICPEGITIEKDD